MSTTQDKHKILLLHVIYGPPVHILGHCQPLVCIYVPLQANFSRNAIPQYMSGVTIHWTGPLD